MNTCMFSTEQVLADRDKYANFPSSLPFFLPSFPLSLPPSLPPTGGRVGSWKWGGVGGAKHEGEGEV